MTNYDDFGERAFAAGYLIAVALGIILALL